MFALDALLKDLCMEISKTKPMFSGLKLGMIMQVGGMGPICFLLFQLASLLPLPTVIGGVAAVTLVDAIYISISVMGILGIIKQTESVSEIFKKITGVVILFLGLSFSLMFFSEETADIFAEYDWNAENIFATLFLLTIINPVTIFCYTGVFTANLIDKKINRRQLILFALGTLCSTPIYLSLIAIAGALGGHFLPVIVVKALNLLVGLILVYWGLKYIFPKVFKHKNCEGKEKA